MSRRGYLELSHGQLHIRQAGSSARPVVLLHQVPSSSAMWEAVLGHFAEAGFRAIAIDLPGYGLSDPYDHEPSLADYAATAAELLSELELERAAFIGHHTGASVALQLAVDRPELVAALALWGVALLDEAFAERLRTEPPFRYGPDGELVRSFFRRRYEMADPSVAERVAVRSVAEAMLSGEHRPEGHRAVGNADHARLLACVDVPLLAMAGDRELLREETQRAVALVKSGRYAHLGNAGTDVADEQPERFVTTVVSFFSECHWEGTPYSPDR